MSWQLILTVVFYLAGGAAVWAGTSFTWFRASPTGRKCRPLLVLLWPLAILVIVFIAVVCSIDLAYQARADATFGPERGE